MVFSMTELEMDSQLTVHCLFIIQNHQGVVLTAQQVQPQIFIPVKKPKDLGIWVERGGGNRFQYLCKPPKNHTQDHVFALSFAQAKFVDHPIVRNRLPPFYERGEGEGGSISN